ncbi:DUF2267 domain-containing protein [Parasphingorhabdus sp.]|uniref:DUF2267 domain-containing protein n=1 Tax=Parasphingorhabdus sp. TaxID=2709688 RepID=UPI003A8E4DC3
MSALGLPIFDKAIQDANIWVNDIMYELDWEDKHRAYTLLRSTLHVLRDRLQTNEAAHFSAQLPTLIRGIFFEGYNPAKGPSNIRHKDEFVAAVEQAFGNDPNADPETTVSAALDVIADHISEGEMDDVKSSLPSDIRNLWH